jgi:hypothetical protein
MLSFQIPCKFEELAFTPGFGMLFAINQAKDQKIDKAKPRAIVGRKATGPLRDSRVAEAEGILRARGIH